ncbi:dnaJ homolog subfamily C member 16 isoform X2 [Hyalella azteca]|uniref:DnaJ homolog subfamily C member 16 isoform X2 n=1 Tax=Hyalella azteca TaxID=294128 RepID=A0A8B7PAF3_HYAAZ|nr:dnaJ homolog subfamily C member 16 isoform X2 [Hyalella azteca]
MNFLAICIYLNLFIVSFARIRDPYSILGVDKHATTKEIKNAYKQLVKEWHPDKNPSPEAQSKFIEISEAHKLLSDPERRSLYDKTGQTDDQPNFRNHDEFSAFHNQDPFASFFGGGAHHGFRFKFAETMKIYHEQSINFKTYENVISGRSRQQPYLLLFYSDFCMACSHIEPIWQKLVEELQPINFGIATVHAGREAELARKIGVTTVPYLIMLMDAHPYHYREPSLSMASSLEFIRGRFSQKLVQRLDDSNIDAFLGGWMDNRVRVVIFGHLDVIRLRYLTVAWEFRQRALIGYVQIGLRSTEAVVSRYAVSTKVDTLLVFREDASTPAASVAMADLPYATMRDVISTHQFLMLPRLSSQSVFEGLCPVSVSRTRRHFCAVLFTENSARDDEARAALRQYALERQPSHATHDSRRPDHHSQRADTRYRHLVNYAYIFQEKQAHFVNALVGVSASPSEVHQHVAILWRSDSRRIKFTWVPKSWQPDDDSDNVHSSPEHAYLRYNTSSSVLTASIERLLTTDAALPYETELQELFDEHANGILWRILTRLSHWHEALWQSLSKDDLYVVFSMMATVVLIVGIGFLMHYKVKKEEEYLASKGVDLNPSSSNCASKSPQLPIHELRGETYNGMVRLLKPGCRTIVLLCDSHTKPKLMPMFYKSCWPYRRNKTLMFGFMNMERHSAMEWYKRILLLGLPEPRDLKINPKNTIGTVIALNGHRKYYCLYHAKHPEDTRKRQDSDSESETSGSDVEVGNKKKDAMGTNKPLLNYYSSVLFEEQLLEGFSNWLDRLFEGSTHRYAINYWPDWPGK